MTCAPRRSRLTRIETASWISLPSSTPHPLNIKPTRADIGGSPSRGLYPGRRWEGSEEKAERSKVEGEDRGSRIVRSVMPHALPIFDPPSSILYNPQCDRQGLNYTCPRTLRRHDRTRAGRVRAGVGAAAGVRAERRAGRAE